MGKKKIKGTRAKLFHQHHAVRGVLRLTLTINLGVVENYK